LLESFVELLESCSLLTQLCSAFLKTKVTFSIKRVHSLIRLGQAKSSAYSLSRLRLLVIHAVLQSAQFFSQAGDGAEQYAHSWRIVHRSSALVELNVFWWLAYD